MSSSGPFRHAGAIIGWIISLGTLAAGIWSIVWGIENWQHGIYAGFHYGGAKQYVAEVMAENQGWAFVQQLKLDKPDVINTHSRGLLQGGQQIRVFHLIGPRGVRWCVSVWDGGYRWNSDYAIDKGCKAKY